VELADRVLALIVQLTGQEQPLPARKIARVAVELLNDPARGLGHGQFNELLLDLGYDRVSHSFFQYLVDETTEYRSGTAFHSVAELEAAVIRFRKLGMLVHGNVKFAFKTMSSDRDDLLDALNFIPKRTEGSFKDRHDPIHRIEKIPSDRTYYLGYVIKDDLAKTLKDNPGDEDALRQRTILDETVKIAKRNYEAYLVSDHLDVYVATSMREPHEYQMVHKVTEEIFSAPALRDLQLRYFDPTQADCVDRLDKGLAEALMLKRAKCTIYLAQEGDTLGKDSELASTLAQGKPVIAYVPDPPTDYAENLIAALQKVYPRRDKRTLVLDQLRLFEPKSAWEESRDVRRWIDSPETFDLAVATRRLQIAINKHYDKRAHTLREVHPLGIQVNLGTGVANGVLVVRYTHDCAQLVRRILMGQMEFDIQEKAVEGVDGVYLLLREKISGCVFRVVTGDKMLTNSFWNFYLLNPIDEPPPIADEGGVADAKKKPDS
jgi:hypothetical protein